MNDKASKLKGLMWVGVATLLGAGFAAGLAPLAHIIPFSWEKHMSGVIGMDETPCHNAAADTLLKKLVARIYPVREGDDKFSIEVNIVKNTQVNAYAQLGGFISVNSGLLAKAQSPEELAGVLAHEIEHVHNRHILQGALVHLFTAQGLSVIFGGADTGEWTNYFLSMNFTRAQEQQADEEGLKRLQAGHVDNNGFKRFFERMEKDEGLSAFISDHPASHSRSQMVSQFDNKGATPIMGASEWATLKAYCAQ